MDEILGDNQEEQIRTVIGASAVIQGELIGEENIKIDGQITGKIQTIQMVAITADAKVTAEIEAESAIIGGEVQGHVIVSGRLVLLPTAKVAADIRCPTLKVEEGALYTGKCHMAGNIPTMHQKKTS
jgi:cytoskeletal protein CcmA (bactofilin family)